MAWAIGLPASLREKGIAFDYSEEIWEQQMLTEMARACQVVVVSVPIGVTCTVIEKVGPHMQRRCPPHGSHLSEA